MTAPDRPGVTGHEQRFPARHQWELLVEHGEGSELGMWSFHPAIQNLGKRRVFEIQFTGEAGEGLEPLYLNYDGEQLGDVTPPFEAGGEMMLPDYRPYTVGLELGGKSTHENVHLFFSVMGRVTGRFADREWWTAPRAFYRIPAG